MSGKIDRMAKLTLVYGMRLLPSDDIEEVGEAPVKLKNGRTANVTLHIVEGSRKTLKSNCARASTLFSICIRKFKPEGFASAGEGRWFRAKSACGNVALAGTVNNMSSLRRRVIAIIR